MWREEIRCDKFQSTPSVWRETDHHKRLLFGRRISIHSLRVEGDTRLDNRIRDDCHFNPLPPCGGRPDAALILYALYNFNPLPPCGGRLCIFTTILWKTAFQSTPSVWRETL